MRVAAVGNEPFHPGRTGQLDPGRYQVRLGSGDLHPADLLVADVGRRHAVPAADALDDRGARARIGVEAVRGGRQLRVVRVSGDEPVVAVRDQVDGTLACGVILPVAALVQGQCADRQPGPAGQDADHRGEHEDIGHRSVAEDLGPVHPRVRVRVTGPESGELRYPDQDEDHQRDRDDPPQAAA